MDTTEKDTNVIYLAAYLKTKAEQAALEAQKNWNDDQGFQENMMKGLLLTALILVALAIAVHAHANPQGFDNNGNYTGFQGNNGYQQGQNDQAQKEQRETLTSNVHLSSNLGYDRLCNYKRSECSRYLSNVS